MPSLDAMIVSIARVSISFASFLSHRRHRHGEYASHERDGAREGIRCDPRAGSAPFRHPPYGRRRSVRTGDNRDRRGNGAGVAPRSVYVHKGHRYIRTPQGRGIAGTLIERLCTPAGTGGMMVLWAGMVVLAWRRRSTGVSCHRRAAVGRHAKTLNCSIPRNTRAV